MPAINPTMSNVNGHQSWSKSNDESREAGNHPPAAEVGRKWYGRIVIRTGNRVTRSRTFSARARRVFHFNRAKAGDTPSVRAGYKFDKGVDKLVEDITRGKIRTPDQYHARMFAIIDQARSNGMPGSIDDLAERFNANLEAAMNALETHAKTKGDGKALKAFHKAQVLLNETAGRMEQAYDRHLDSWRGNIGGLNLSQASRADVSRRDVNAALTRRTIPATARTARDAIAKETDAVRKPLLYGTAPSRMQRDFDRHSAADSVQINWVRDYGAMKSDVLADRMSEDELRAGVTKLMGAVKRSSGSIMGDDDAVNISAHLRKDVTKNVIRASGQEPVVRDNNGKARDLHGDAMNAVQHMNANQLKNAFISLGAVEDELFKALREQVTRFQATNEYENRMS